MIRVLLADDQALVRAGFRALLDAQDDIEVVGEAGDGDEAATLALRLRPDVVLMDIRMPGTDGLAATRAIAGDDRLADVRIVILTTFELDEYVFEAIRSGASGFLVKDTEPVELLRAVRAVAAGDALLSPAITKRVAGALPYTKYNLFMRWIMKRIVKKQGGDTDTSRDYDYTDWDDLRQFAAEFGRRFTAAA